jgi:hypothetical protein
VTDEKTVDFDRVRREHLKEVQEPAHWAYLGGVLAGGLVLMLLLIGVLDAISG